MILATYSRLAALAGILATGLAVSPATAGPGDAPSSPTTSAAARPDESRTLPVYFLKPKAANIGHLHDMGKILDDMNLVRKVRVDRHTGHLVVQCAASELPQVQELLEKLQSSPESKLAPGAAPEQVALEVKVILGSTAAPAQGAAGALDDKLAKRLGDLFGYKSFTSLGMQLLTVKVGERASSETHFRAPGSEREFPFGIDFTIQPGSGDLEIRAAIKAIGQAAAISTTFLTAPGKSVILGNSTLKTGEALIYIVTPRLDTVP